MAGIVEKYRAPRVIPDFGFLTRGYIEIQYIGSFLDPPMYLYEGPYGLY